MLPIQQLRESANRRRRTRAQGHGQLHRARTAPRRRWWVSRSKLPWPSICVDAAGERLARRRSQPLPPKTAGDPLQAFSYPSAPRRLFSDPCQLSPPLLMLPTPVGCLLHPNGLTCSSNFCLYLSLRSSTPRCSKWGPARTAPSSPSSSSCRRTWRSRAPYSVVVHAADCRTKNLITWGRGGPKHG